MIIRILVTRAYVWNLCVKVASIDQHPELFDDLRHLDEKVLVGPCVAPSGRAAAPFSHTRFSDMNSALDQRVRQIHLKGFVSATFVCENQHNFVTIK